MSIFKTIEFKLLGDERGSLISLEKNRNIPFDINRVYYIFDTMKGVSRGFHAHRNLIQLAICIKGSCNILMDNGINQEVIHLNSPSLGILIDKMQWHEMHDFSNDCVLMVLANDHYDENDYIRNYEEFLKVLYCDT